MKKNQNMTKKHSLGDAHRVLTCFWTLSLRKMYIRVYPDYFSYGSFFTISYFFYFWNLKSQLIKFCIIFQGKQAKFLLSKCSTLLLRKWPTSIKPIGLLFFKNFKTKRAIYGLNLEMLKFTLFSEEVYVYLVGCNLWWSVSVIVIVIVVYAGSLLLFKW